MLMDPAILWLGLVIVLLAVEIATVNLTTIWFAGGAIVAFISTFYGANAAAQRMLFVGISLLLLVVTRPIVVRYVKGAKPKTNADSLIGRMAIVTKEIDNLNQSGEVMIADISWTARSREDNCKIAAGSKVKICAIEGVKLIVEEIKEEGLVAVLVLVILIILASCIKIVPQATALVMERLGAYNGTWGVGIHFKAPFIDRVARKVTLKEQVVDFAPQPVITKDNVTMRIDTVVFFQITDPKLFAYGVENPIMAIENLTATTLRNIIGDLELDQTLTSRETINTKMRASLDVATDPWGIKVNRVELKNIIPPAAIQDAMEKQMKAERERREAILKAEGEKKSTILVAEGHKESAILDAEAEKQAAILRAEAEKEKMIKEAEGQAAAILKVQQANAMGLRYLKEVGVDESVIRLKSLEAFQKVADGQATKIIIPSDIQKLAGVVTSAVELSKE